MDEERLNLDIRTFTSPKTFSALFLQCSTDPWRHNPMNTKQSKHHCPQLICYRTLKKKVIYCFPRPFAHTTIVYHNNSLFPKIIYIIKILPKVADRSEFGSGWIYCDPKPDPLLIGFGCLKPDPNRKNGSIIGSVFRVSG